MNQAISCTQGPHQTFQATSSTARSGAFRRSAVAAAVAVCVGLTACGGGADIYLPDTAFDIGVVVAGLALAGLVIGPGTTQSVAMQAGQSIELDANQPVAWTLDVGGTTVGGNGVTVFYGGIAITQTAASDSRIVVSTSPAGPSAVPVTITFIATSTINSAQVATVNVTITI